MAMLLATAEMAMRLGHGRRVAGRKGIFQGVIKLGHFMLVNVLLGFMNFGWVNMLGCATHGGAFQGSKEGNE